MTSDRIVEAVDVTPDRLLGLGSGLEDGAPDQLGFQALKERLDHRVVKAIPFPRHRDRDAVFLQHSLVLEGAILAAAVRMMAYTFTGPSDYTSLAQRLKS